MQQIQESQRRSLSSLHSNVACSALHIHGLKYEHRASVADSLVRNSCMIQILIVLKTLGIHSILIQLCAQNDFVVRGRSLRLSQDSGRIEARTSTDRLGIEPCLCSRQDYKYSRHLKVHYFGSPIREAGTVRPVDICKMCCRDCEGWP
jgi:hypothetical protein